MKKTTIIEVFLVEKIEKSVNFQIISFLLTKQIFILISNFQFSMKKKTTKNDEK
jgi:hypothetical protein